MTIHLTPAQAELWQRGWWDARHIEEDCLELVDAQQITEPVAVMLPDGVTVAFGITPPRRQGRNHG